MKTNDIDKLDKKNYNSLKLCTAGTVLYFTALVLHELTVKYSYPILVLRIVGIVFLIISIYGIISVKNKSKTDPVLKEALFDEMYQIHMYKAFKRGFFSMFYALFLIVGISEMIDISIIFTCQIVMFAGILGMIFSLLKSQKEKK